MSGIKIPPILQLVYDSIAEEAPVDKIVPSLDLHRDVFGMLYMPKYEFEEEDAPTILKKVEEMEEFNELRRETIFNDVLAYVGSTEIVRNLKDQHMKMTQSCPHGGQGDGKGQQQQTDQIAVHAVKAVMRKATQAVEEAKAMMSVAGVDPGQLHKMDIKDKVKLVQMLLEKHKNVIYRILELANKLMARSKNEMAKDPEYLPTKISKVHLSDDVSHLADPSVLVDDDLFYASYMDRKLVTYEIKDRWDKKRGPLIVLVDTSGSMSGEKTIWAKALAVVFRKIALEQKRRIRVVLFSYSSDIHVIDFSPNKLELSKLYDMIDYEYGGGTSFEGAYRQAIEFVEKDDDFHHASIIMVTDGECDDISDSTKKWLREFINQDNKNIVITVNVEHMDNMDELIPNTLYIPISITDPNLEEIMVNIIKGEMYVRGNLFKRAGPKS